MPKDYSAATGDAHTGSQDRRWVDLIAVSELDVGDVTPVPFNGSLLAVYDTQSGITVSDARCTHAGANLCDGYFDGRHIECPLHQGLFDASTGKACAAPVTRDLQMFRVRVQAGWVQIMMAEEGLSPSS